MIDVSIIFVNYNSAALLNAAINSVINFTSGLSYEIIVVDNNSNERSIEKVVSSFSQINFIQNKENIGFGKACNLAVENSQGQFLLFLNPDTVLKNNAISYFLNFYNENNKALNIGCLGAQLFNEKNIKIHSFGDFPEMKIVLKNKFKSLFSKVSGKGFSQVVQSKNTGVIHSKVDYVTGASMFLSRSNFDLVKGFSPEFFMYFEETDLQYKLSKNDLNSYLIYTPQIQHHQGASFEGNNVKMRVLYFDGLLSYFKKNSDPIKYFFFKVSWYLLDFKTVIQKIFTPKANN